MANGERGTGNAGFILHNSPFQILYSLRSASTGSMRAARHAGRKPETTQVNNETSKANAVTGREREAGKNLVMSRVRQKAMPSPTRPPRRQMLAASIRN